jgi:hypothetical protein
MPSPPMEHTSPPIQQQRAKLHADVGLTDFAITIHAPQDMPSFAPRFAVFRNAKGRILKTHTCVSCYKSSAIGCYTIS